MKINKLNYNNKILININNISLILCYLILSNYYINILIILLIFKIIFKNNYIKKYNESWFKVIFLSILIYYLFNIYFMNNVIYMDSTEYLTLYNNIYIKGLNSLVEIYGELTAYAVGVKLSSIYLKTLPTEPTFYFHFGLGVGPSLDLTVHQESYDSPVDSSYKNYVLLTVDKVEDHINFIKDMVPFHHKHYKTSKMTNMENNTTIISGDAPTNINVVNIHCPLEPSELYVNYFYTFENLVFNISFIFYFLFLSIYFIFLTIKFINFIKFIRFIKIYNIYTLYIFTYF